MESDSTDSGKRRPRRRWQWTIRSMFILTAVVAVAMGLYFGHDRRASARAVATFRSLGGHVIYDYQREGETNYVKVARVLGEDYFGSVASVRIDGGYLDQSKLDMLQHLPSVEMLLLSNIVVDGDNWQVLAKLPEVRELELSACRFGDDDIEVLKGLAKLRTLSLNGTMITAAGLKKLAEFKQLKSLFLLETHITAEDLAEIRAALPKCRIQDISPAALAAILVTPDGKRTNRYQGQFKVELSTQGRSISQQSTDLRPGQLWFDRPLTINGPVTLTVTLDQRLTGRVQVQVKDGVAEPRFVEVQMREMKREGE